jgi:hypothetical protein
MTTQLNSSASIRNILTSFTSDDGREELLRICRIFVGCNTLIGPRYMFNSDRSRDNLIMSINEQTTGTATRPETEATQPSPAEARDMLRNLSENGFDGSIGNTALALGRDDEFISDALSGDQEIDEDLIIKIRGLAQERNIPIEEEGAGGNGNEYE